MQQKYVIPSSASFGLLYQKDIDKFLKNNNIKYRFVKYSVAPYNFLMHMGIEAEMSDSDLTAFKLLYDKNPISEEWYNIIEYYHEKV